MLHSVKGGFEARNGALFLLTMRFSFLVLVLATLVTAKNVWDLGALQKDIKNDGLVEKRDPKNVFSLKNNVQKREPRNVFHGFDLKDKREPKRVFAGFKEPNTKRDQHFISITDNVLQSIIPQESDISIFGGYIRNNEDIDHQTSLDEGHLVIIAPSDQAISTKLLGLKPWEFPRSIEEAEEENQDALIEKNLNDFLFSHIIGAFDTVQVTDFGITTQLLNGKPITIKQDATSGTFTLLFEGRTIPVVRGREVDNGYLFVIDDVLSSP